MKEVAIFDEEREITFIRLMNADQSLPQTYLEMNVKRHHRIMHLQKYIRDHLGLEKDTTVNFFLGEAF